MSIDGIEIIKHYKDKELCLNNLKLIAKNYQQNSYVYSIAGSNDMKLIDYVDSNKIKILGSIPYFVNGHNFTSSIDDLKTGIDTLESIIKTDLYNAEVNSFEYGKSLSIPFKQECVFSTHLKVKGMKTRNYDDGKYFVSTNNILKLYNVNKNITNKLTLQKRHELALIGYDNSKNYLDMKWHIKSPIKT